MKILVAISIVPDTTSKIDFLDDNYNLDKNSIQFIINPYDEICLTKAMHLKEKYKAKVTIISVGTKVIEPVLRKALAMGADNAIRIDTKPIHSVCVAKELAKVIKEENYDLLFFGKESIDYNGGIVPSMVASILDYSFVNACIQLELINDKSKKIRLVREVDQGKEFLFTFCPLIIAGQRGLVEDFELKTPSIRGIIQARNKPIKVQSPVFIENRIKINNFEKLILRKSVHFIDLKNIEELIQLLKEKSKINF